MYPPGTFPIYRVRLLQDQLYHYLTRRVPKGDPRGPLIVGILDKLGEAESKMRALTSFDPTGL